MSSSGLLRNVRAASACPAPPAADIHLDHSLYVIAQTFTDFEEHPQDAEIDGRGVSALVRGPRQLIQIPANRPEFGNAPLQRLQLLSAAVLGPGDEREQGRTGRSPLAFREPRHARVTAAGLRAQSNVDALRRPDPVGPRRAATLMTSTQTLAAPPPPPCAARSIP